MAQNSPPCYIIFTNDLYSSAMLTEALIHYNKVKTCRWSKAIAPCMLILIIEDTSSGKYAGLSPATRRLRISAAHVLRTCFGTVFTDSDSARLLTIETRISPRFFLVLPFMLVSSITPFLSNLVRYRGINNVVLLIHFTEEEALGIYVLRRIREFIRRHGPRVCPREVVVTHQLLTPQLDDNVRALNGDLRQFCGKNIRYEDYISISSNVLDSVLTREALGDIRIKTIACIPNDTCVLEWLIDYLIAVGDKITEYIAEHTRGQRGGFQEIELPCNRDTNGQGKNDIEACGIRILHAYIQPCTRLPGISPQVSQRLKATIVFGQGGVSRHENMELYITFPVVLTSSRVLKNIPTKIPFKLRPGCTVAKPRLPCNGKSYIGPCMIRSYIDHLFKLNARLTRGEAKSSENSNSIRVDSCLTQSGVPSEYSDIVAYVFSRNIVKSIIDKRLEKLEPTPPKIQDNIPGKEQGKQIRRCRTTHLYAYSCPHDRLYVDITLDCSIGSEQQLNRFPGAINSMRVSQGGREYYICPGHPCHDNPMCPASALGRLGSCRKLLNCVQQAKKVYRESIEECLEDLFYRWGIPRNAGLDSIKVLTYLTLGSLNLQIMMINALALCLVEKMSGKGMLDLLEQLGSKRRVLPVIQSRDLIGAMIKRLKHEESKNSLYILLGGLNAASYTYRVLMHSVLKKGMSDISHGIKNFIHEAVNELAWETCISLD